VAIRLSRFWRYTVTLTLMSTFLPGSYAARIAVYTTWSCRFGRIWILMRASVTVNACINILHFEPSPLVDLFLFSQTVYHDLAKAF
jgi:hypothetical protein